jgi:hypothetical protein
MREALSKRRSKRAWASITFIIVQFVLCTLGVSFNDKNAILTFVNTLNEGGPYNWITFHSNNPYYLACFVNFVVLEWMQDGYMVRLPSANFKLSNPNKWLVGKLWRRFVIWDRNYMIAALPTFIYLASLGL